MTDPLRTPLTDMLGCRFPIIQTAMGWVSTPQLVNASIEAGAFGFLAGAVMKPDELRTAIDQVRRASSRPFGVNFHMSQPGAGEIVEIILASRDQVKAVSFGRGPDARMIGRFKDAGIKCVPTIGAVKHAEKMAKLGVDMVVVQGGEGGGHTGSVASTVLLPQVLDAVDLPVVAAGGFADGRGLAAALAFGAAGVAMGTRFLMTQESPVADAVKRRYVGAMTDDIIVTRKIDGIPQRMIRNARVDRIERSTGIGRWWRAAESGIQFRRATGASFAEILAAARSMASDGGLTLSQAMMAAIAPLLIQKAVVEGDVDQGVMATGLVAGRLDDLPTCRDLVDRIVNEARGRLTELSNPSVARGVTV